jgi:hypothetical protein
VGVDRRNRARLDGAANLEVIRRAADRQYPAMVCQVACTALCRVRDYAG